MKELSLSKAYRFLEPGPVVLVTTAYKGSTNIMTMSYYMIIQDGSEESGVPLIGCSIGPWDHSFKALRATGECVIAVPTVDLASKVVEIGNCSGDDVDKFDAFGLTPVPAKKVKAPLVAECLANLDVGCQIPAWSTSTTSSSSKWSRLGPIRSARNTE